MTNEEARNTLKSIKEYYNDKNEDSYVGFDKEDNEALDMAIEVLEILANADKIIESIYGCVIIEGYSDVIDQMNETFNGNKERKERNNE